MKSWQRLMVPTTLFLSTAVCSYNIAEPGGKERMAPGQKKGGRGRPSKGRKSADSVRAHPFASQDPSSYAPGKCPLSKSISNGETFSKNRTKCFLTYRDRSLQKWTSDTVLSPFPPTILPPTGIVLGPLKNHQLKTKSRLNALTLTFYVLYVI